MNQYSFKIHDGELGASAQLTITAENPPTGEVFDKLVSEIRKQAIATSFDVEGEGRELESMDPDKMTQKQFEKFRTRQEARRKR